MAVFMQQMPRDDAINNQFQNFNCFGQQFNGGGNYIEEKISNLSPYPSQGNSNEYAYGNGNGNGIFNGQGGGMGNLPKSIQISTNAGGDYNNGYDNFNINDFSYEDVWRQEYSSGNGPEYEAEALWTQEPCTEEDDLNEVHVYGPAGDHIPPAVTTFAMAAQLYPPKIVERLYSEGFAAPTAIQAHTWAIGAAGRDLIGIAKTGSGKTLAFLMPGFLKILQSHSRLPTLCVMAPTRELACQIEVEAEKFGRPVGIRTVCCYGGAPRGQQLGALRRGCQIVVACPGRLNDFIQSDVANLSNVSLLVLDEADRMLDMGFEPQIRQVIERIPQGRQTLLFTATWPREVRSLASEYLSRPIHVQTGTINEMTVNKDIEQHVLFVQNEQEKAQGLLSILGSLSSTDRCLIFCEMKKSAEVLAQELMRYHRVPAVRIHGDMAQADRTRALEAFKNGRSPILVATDVAARGIDVKGVTCVINYDACGSAKDYVHRIGRTGRAGAKGKAYTLLLPAEDKKAKDIVNVLYKSGLPIPLELQSFAKTSNKGKSGGKGRMKGGKGFSSKGKGGYGKGGGKGGGKGRGKKGKGAPGNGGFSGGGRAGPEYGSNFDAGNRMQF